MKFERYAKYGEAHGALHDLLFPLIRRVKHIPGNPSRSHLDSLPQHGRQSDQQFG